MQISPASEIPAASKCWWSIEFRCLTIRNSRRTGVITEDTRCMGFGYALIVRVDAWSDRELILHNLIHIAQCERAGGLQPWCREYLGNRNNSPKFTIGTLEAEARRFAREICGAEAAA